MNNAPYMAKGKLITLFTYLEFNSGVLWIHNINVIRNFINFVSDPGYCTTWSRAMSDFDLNHNQSLWPFCIKWTEKDYNQKDQR